MKTRDGIRRLTVMSVLAALALILTFLIRIPVPATQGYIHPGDAVVILGVLMMGKRDGALAGALGQGLADLMGGYAIFAPVSFVAKLVMGLLAGLAFERIERYRQERQKLQLVAGVLFMVLALVSMAGIYYVCEAAVYGSFVIPLVEIPMNIIQFAFGAVLGVFVWRPVKKILFRI